MVPCRQLDYELLHNAHLQVPQKEVIEESLRYQQSEKKNSLHFAQITLDDYRPTIKKQESICKKTKDKQS